MANILLTTKCNRSCPYCFAEREMADSPPGERLSWENLIYLADFLQASGEKRISLLGGEPTLHPDFVDFALYLVERKFGVTVFTNGIVSESKLDEIKEHFTLISAGQLNFICNLNDPDQTPAPLEATRKVHQFLSVMGPWTSAGFNIYRLDFKLEFLCDLINRYGMKRNIRLGIAHPVPGEKSIYIRPDDVRHVVERLYGYRQLLNRFRIKPDFDCGFPVCRLTDEQLGWLFRLTGQANFDCGLAIDIAPDMSVYCCFPFSRFHRRSIFEFDSLQQVYDYYKKVQQRIREELPGIYDECDGCIHLQEGICSGGGGCQLLNRLVDEAPVRLPEIESELQAIRLSS